MSNWMNSAGLIMDIAGVLLTYFNTPLHTRKTGPSGDPISEAAHYHSWGRRLERSERRMIRLGFGLIVAGFLAQFLAGFL